ncbi:hypothetical protein ACLFKQ_09245 [Myxosarcina sp. GI1(2024)]
MMATSVFIRLQWFVAPPYFKKFLFLLPKIVVGRTNFALQTFKFRDRQNWLETPFIKYKD